MAFSKANLYPIQDQITSNFAQVFSHPARSIILRQLNQKGATAVEDICIQHPLALPSISDHLKTLRESKLVTYQLKHPYIIYDIDQEMLAKAEDQFILFFSSFKQ